jgi:glycosyltransferase involved in cell wall biosynthesis
MACGVPVVASDLPVLREVGGSAAEYCPIGDVAGWSAKVRSMIHERSGDPEAWNARRQAALTQASRFSWSSFTDCMVELYRAVANASAR